MKLQCSWDFTHGHFILLSFRIPTGIQATFGSHILDCCLHCVVCLCLNQHVRSNLSTSSESILHILLFPTLEYCWCFGLQECISVCVTVVVCSSGSCALRYTYRVHRTYEMCTCKRIILVSANKPLLQIKSLISTPLFL